MDKLPVGAYEKKNDLIMQPCVVQGWRHSS